MKKNKIFKIKMVKKYKIWIIAKDICVSTK